uniref:Uncharacterized protein n=1 Tax=viral metagenome TaxID=1070528 RepID=A0A6M3IYN4_9ZZZZ
MPEEEISEQTSDIPADEGAAFASEVDEDKEIFEGLEKSEEKSEKKPEGELEEKLEKKSEEKVEDELEEEEPEKDAEEDEDVIRGKELLEVQEKEAAEREAAEKVAKTQRADEGGYSPFTEKHDAKSLEFFKSIIPQNMFPDAVTLEDGTELDFKSVYESEPEIPVMIATIANNLIRQMISNKFLITANDMVEIRDEIDNRFFESTLTNKHDGVPNARDIFNSAEFKKWLPDQPKEIQALRNSIDPYDHIRLFKRFMNSSGLESAKSKVKSLDEKRRASKKNFDAIHSTTVRSKSKAGGSALDPREEELAGFNSPDDTDDILP